MGLLDSLYPSSQPTPTGQGLLGFGNALIQASLPHYGPRRSNLATLAASAPEGINAYRSAADRQKLMEALNQGDMQTAATIMATSPDPQLQQLGLSTKLQQFSPDYQLKMQQVNMMKNLFPGGGSPDQPGAMPSPGAPPVAPPGMPPQGAPAAPVAAASPLPPGMSPQQLQGLAFVNPTLATSLSTIQNQSPAGKKQAEQAAEEGKQTGQMKASYETMKPIVSNVNAALDKLNELADKTPYGDFGVADTQSKLANTLGPRAANFGLDTKGTPLDPQLASNANTWDRLVAEGVMNGLQQMRGLGPLRIPEMQLNDALKGIDLAASPQQKKQAIGDLRHIFANELEAKRVGVGNMENPAPDTNAPGHFNYGAPPQPAGSPAAPPQAKLPPAAAIAMLKANPALAQQFEAKYGIPAASILGGGNAGQ